MWGGPTTDGSNKNLLIFKHFLQLKVEASLDSLSFPIKGKDLQLILDKKKEIHVELYK